MPGSTVPNFELMPPALPRRTLCALSAMTLILAVALTSCSDDTTGGSDDSDAASLPTTADVFAARAVLDLFPSAATTGGETAPGPLTEADANDQMTGTDCSLTPLPSTPDEVIIACDADNNVYRLGAAEFDGGAVASAEVETSPAQDTASVPVVLVTLTESGKQTLADVTSTLAGQQPPTDQLALVVDGAVVSAPSVAEPIEGGQLQIAGAFTETEAQDLVDSLTSSTG